MLDGVEPPTRTDYDFLGWNCSGKPVFSGTTYAELAGDKNVQSITLTAQWAAAWYPEGEIKIEGEDTVWNGFESDYSARFYNTEQTVTISAPKSGGKPVEIGYLITDEDLTKARCTKRDFTPYTEPLKLNTDGQHIVYAKLTNAEGNVTYLRTTGRIVIDTTAPQINGIEDGKTYYVIDGETVTAYPISDVTAIDMNLDSFSVNGKPISISDADKTKSVSFSAPYEESCTYKFIATDKAGNVTEKTVNLYYNDKVVSVTGVSLNESSITLDVGGSKTLAATVTPDNATNKKVRWTSDNETVATVSEDGVVTAVAGGTAVITATTHDGLFTATCTVTVNAPDAAPTITTDTLPDGKVGEAYSQILTATGTTPITWSVENGGNLPAGLSLNKDTGEISGTPTAAGTSTFTVKATNSAGSDTKELSITITKAAPPSHEHNYGDWSKDGTNHWHECTDDDCPNREESITDKAAHVYDDDTDTTCNVCGYERTVTPPAHEHIVTFDGNGGTPSVGSMTTTNQKLPSLPSASRSGSYSFDGWYTEKSGGTKITTATVFHANTTVYAHWTYTGGGGGGYNPPVTYYTLRFETGGGSDIPSVQGTYNTYIDLTQYVPTWRGHTFIGWYTERSLMNKVSGVYLTKDMTVYAGWRVDENPNTGANPFTDVSEKDWFYGDVMFVYENGLMLGTSKTLFSPHGTATCGMMATILWRMEGSPAPKGKNSFTDVEAGKWYADAITWTAENGIFAGYGKDKFGPDDPITREQLAAIFYRYADYKGYDLTVKGNLDKFKDADKITDYAKTAMQWAVGSSLVKGKSGNLLDPQGTATRAEIAAMLHRFIEKYELVQGKAPGGLMGWIDPKRLQIPKTGDSSVLGLWGFSLCISLAGCLALTTWQIRRWREEEALQIIEK